MYSVEIDRSKRLLVISALQRVTAEDAKLVAQQVRELLRDVPPGFRVLADFRWLESMDSAAAHHVAEIMDTLTEKGVASVTRVMPRSAQGHWTQYPVAVPLPSRNPNRYFRDIS
jgi:anti-anti-sigma regulatory factor